MTSQAKVLDFLDFGGLWDPSLAFVMGCGIMVSGPAFLYAERETSKPLCADCNFEKPAKHGGYGPLVLGASFFGLGWGLIGICPGPGIAGSLHCRWQLGRGQLWCYDGRDLHFLAYHGYLADGRTENSAMNF